MSFLTVEDSYTLEDIIYNNLSKIEIKESQIIYVEDGSVVRIIDRSNLNSLNITNSIENGKYFSYKTKDDQTLCFFENVTILKEIIFPESTHKVLIAKHVKDDS